MTSGRQTSGGAVLFDAVGTLIYPEPPVGLVYQAAGRKHGSSRSVEEISSRFRQAFRRQEQIDAAQGHAVDESRERRRWQAIVAEVFDDVRDSSPLFEELWQHFALPGHWALFDDVAAACERLAKQKTSFGVASNFDGRLHAICQATPRLAQCWRFVSSEVGCRKPCREFFAAIQRATGLEPTQLLLVGDDLENDYHGARAAGWHALLLTRGGPVADVPAEHQIASLAELVCPWQDQAESGKV